MIISNDSLPRDAELRLGDTVMYKRQLHERERVVEPAGVARRRRVRTMHQYWHGGHLWAMTPFMARCIDFMMPPSY